MRPWLAGALGLALGACQDDPPVVEFYAFQRPQDLAFACYDTLNDPAEGMPLDLSKAVERPLSCCGQARASNDAEYCGVSPRMHGLLSQTRRGEVAAVNMEPQDGETGVVDSDPTIPGYTFTDVGELPSAVVVPPEDLIDPECGPRWTYVASIGERQVRAVATCRFRRGVACGPEQALDGVVDSNEFTALTRVALPSEPTDMVLDGSGYLWISLPRERALGRIRLNDGADAYADGGAGDGGMDLPNGPGCEVYPTDTDGPDLSEEETLALQQPFLPGPDGNVLQLFPVAGSLPTVTLPLVDDAAYTAWCGLGSGPDYGGDTLQEPPASLPGFGVTDGGLDAGMSDGGLDAGMSDGGLDAGMSDGGLDAGTSDGGPDAGVIPGSGDVLPNRLRFDSTSNLLLASDLAQPFIHAWRIEGETPQPVASIATGAPIWDFALTAAVPSSVELYVDGSENESHAFPPNDVRYIYAIDDRDKSLLAIRWQPGTDGSGTVELVRPQGPVPAADRIFFGGGLASAVTIIDTRSNNFAECSSPDQNTANPGESVRAENPGSLLRGVFAAVVTTDGRLSIIDVHDQDTFCEAFGFSGGTGRCQSNNQAQLNQSQPSEPKQGLAVRRHSLRIGQALLPQGRGDEGELGTLTCPEGYLPIDPDADEGGFLPSGMPAQNTFCINQDPFMQLTDEWTVTYEGLLPVTNGGAGYFPEPTGSGDQARFQLSPGFDVCSLGVVDSEALAAEPYGYPGDFLILPAEPPAGAPDGCETPSDQELPRFPILEAYADHLIVGERLPEDAEEGRMSLERARRCFGPNPDSPAVATGITAFGLGVRDWHLVLGAATGYLNRITTDDTGRCVLDDQLDPRLRARVRVAESDAQCDAPPSFFQNPFVTFCPRLEPGGASRTSYRLTVNVTSAPTVVRPSIWSGSGTAILPVTLSYQPLTRELFIVDSADEGLLEWSVHPVSFEEAFR